MTKIVEILVPMWCHACLIWAKMVVLCFFARYSVRDFSDTPHPRREHPRIGVPVILIKAHSFHGYIAHPNTATPNAHQHSPSYLTSAFALALLIHSTIHQHPTFHLHHHCPSTVQVGYRTQPGTLHIMLGSRIAFLARTSSQFAGVCAM